jgi:hypothetical protein
LAALQGPVGLPPLGQAAAAAGGAGGGGGDGEDVVDGAAVAGGAGGFGAGAGSSSSSGGGDYPVLPVTLAQLQLLQELKMDNIAPVYSVLKPLEQLKALELRVRGGGGEGV